MVLANKIIKLSHEDSIYKYLTQQALKGAREFIKEHNPQ
jgi:hypothetical protein